MQAGRRRLHGLLILLIAAGATQVGADAVRLPATPGDKVAGGDKAAVAAAGGAAAGAGDPRALAATRTSLLRGGDRAPLVPAKAAPSSQAAANSTSGTAACKSVCQEQCRGGSGSQGQGQAAAASLGASPTFQHPPVGSKQERVKRVAEQLQAHADMQQWLLGFFHSSASRLTSSRLGEAKAAHAAILAAAAAAATVPDPEPPAQGAAVPAPEAACDADCCRREAEQVLARQEQPDRFLQLRWQPFKQDRQRWAADRVSEDGVGTMCMLRQPSEPRRRDFLVVAPVGNNMTAINRWLAHPDSATFDLVLLHYGNATNFSCPHCKAVLHAAGPKWQLVWQLTQQPEWRQLIAGKKAVMLADDDVYFDTCAINRAFEVFEAYGLLLGQPSLCPTAHRSTWYGHLIKNNGTILRFVTMVEIMAPMFEMDFFQNFVRPSLHNSFTGWGLDFVWPYLLQYPRDRIGVIDDVCMLHPTPPEAKQGEGSIYAALAKVSPYDAREEEARRDAEYGYYPSEVRALGFPYRPLEVVGTVPRPGYVEPPPLPPLSNGRLLQPWLLYSQVLLMVAAVGMLGFYGRQRRPGSPRRLAPAAPGSPLLPLVQTGGKPHSPLH